MLPVRRELSEEFTPAYAFLIDREFTSGELVATISFCVEMMCARYPRPRPLVVSQLLHRL